MATRRQLNRLMRSLHGHERHERRRQTVADRPSPTLVERPTPRTPAAAIHPLLADEPELTPHEQEHAMLGTLFALEALCTCGHELGFHLFRTSIHPSPCGFSGCDCTDFTEPQEKGAMLNPHDPFAGMPTGDPEPEPLSPGQFVDTLDPEPLPAGDSMVTPGSLPEPEPLTDIVDELAPVTAADVDYLLDRIGGPVGAAADDTALVPVQFPVLVQGAASVPVLELQEPARRVAEIVEALEPVLAPPEAVAQLAALVVQAEALQVTDAASYARGCELYEQLSANEKGIEQTIGPVVAFFHRPWKTLCEFRARYAKPVEEARKGLSDRCGAWKIADDKRAAAEATKAADEAAARERASLEETARIARENAAAAQTPAAKESAEAIAAVVEQAAADVRPATLSPAMFSKAPRTATKARKRKVAVIVDEDAFYKALLEDKTRRVAAPIDLAYLNKQIVDLGDDITQRFPGIEAVDEGGLTSAGSRR